MAKGKELYDRCGRLEEILPSCSGQSRSRCKKAALQIKLQSLLALRSSGNSEHCTRDSRDWPYYAAAEEKASLILKRLA